MKRRSAGAEPSIPLSEDRFEQDVDLMNKPKRCDPTILVMWPMIACILLASYSLALGLDPSLDVSQYAHTSWTTRNGFSLGNIYVMAQTPDGYLWLGTEFGLSRFDGVRFIPWQPPGGQHLPVKDINSLLVTRDGTLWIGTFAGLVILKDGKLTRPPALDDQFVASLFEDSQGTVWASSLGSSSGRLCAMQNGNAQCYGEDGAFGRAVWALYEDSSGTLWAAAQSGLWRIKPGPSRRYATPTELIGLNKADDGRLLVAMHGAGLMHLTGDKVESYPVRGPINMNRLLQDRDLDANRLLRDRNGGLWIGTVERGLIHVHQGRTDVFTRADGLSGDVILSLFEDREGNVWVATTGGLDRFRELPVSTISVKQGLSSDATQAVLAARDGSIWIGAHDGLTWWKEAHTTIFRKANGLPDDAPQSLFEDDRGRIWVSTTHGLAYSKDGRFVATNALSGGEVYSFTEDKQGNLWLSSDQGLLHLSEGRIVERFPWSEMGRRQQAKAVVFEQGGVWLGFWLGGGVLYFKDRQLRASYAAADGLGEGPIQHLRLDQDGALWAATLTGGLSRIKNGRIATLTTGNGLPCNAINWTIEDDDRSIWLYTACGLLRVRRSELDAWIADPTSRIETSTWDASDGVRLRSTAASPYGPTVAKSADGKLWFVTGEGVQVVDPLHLAANSVPPPVHIEKITANGQTFEVAQGLRLPPLIRDLTIDYVALSLVAPEKVRFRYMLEGQDPDWKEVVNHREVQYSNLGPGHYRFRVMACNNSGVWNEEVALLDFSITPAFYQTTWFRLVSVAVLSALLWAAYQLRVRQLATQFNRSLEARVSERTRIARELHDTLLQSFQGLLLRFQSASKLLPERSVEAKQRLESAIDQAAQAITEGRDAVQGLRSSAFETNDLANGITSIAAELTSDTTANESPKIDVEVQGAPRNLNPVVRDEAYRIAGEALRNAFRHSQARRITVEIRYDKRQFRLAVRDDGTGIDDEAIQQQPAGHFGLHGMRERAEIVGGRLELWSKRDTGTEVELSIPGAVAYGTPVHRLWFSKIFSGKSRHNESTEP
jgi:signal transduction histidine kinase/ligand-binding sensor domain-containing protein